MHPGRDNTVAFRAEDGALPLRAYEGPLILVVNRASHNNLVSLRWAHGSRARRSEGPATLHVLDEAVALHAISDIDSTNTILRLLEGLELAACCSSHLSSRRLG